MSINVSCGDTIDPKSAQALTSKSYEWQLICQAVVHRIGECFGEFGVEFPEGTRSEDIQNVSKWNLSVRATSSYETENFEFGESQESEESRSNRKLMYDEVLPIDKMKKVIKLRPATTYMVAVRCFNRKLAMWSVWSPVVQTASLNPVIGRITEIGEDFAHITWSRLPRNTVGLAPEKDSMATKVESDIQNFELRVLQEDDMSEAYASGFSPGTHSHMLQRLHPGTAYIVLMRYNSLIHTQLNWMEVGRFYTQPALEVSLVSCGEDVFSISWKRGELPSDSVCYTVSKADDSLYQIQVESDGISLMMLDVPSSEHVYRAQGLSPGTTYGVWARSISKRGLWGCTSNILKVRTAERPTVVPIAVGESFTSFTWSRSVVEQETKVEYMVKSLHSQYTQQQCVLLSSNGPKEFHVEHLYPGGQYSVVIRTFLNEEWGLWSEPLEFSTTPKSSLSFVERGENFFTIGWPTADLASGAEGGIAKTPEKFHLIVERTSRTGEVAVVEDREETRDASTNGFRIDNLLADTLYQVRLRTWQVNDVTGFEGWGEFSDPVSVRTMRTISLHVVQIGEDFLSLVWHRGGIVDGDDENPFIKYELVVSSAENKEHGLLHKQVKDPGYTITGLKPSSLYEIGVRACDDREQWGLWNTTRVRTLAPVVVGIHDIGEDFVRLMWQRRAEDAPKLSGLSEDSSGDAARMAGADMHISAYEVFVYAKEFLEADVKPHAASGYEGGGNSDVQQYHVVASDHTSFRVTELLPDREYVAVVRACTLTGHKGLWSEPVRFRTNSQFVIPVNSLSIGENYVHLVWSRDPQPISDPEVHLGAMTVSAQQLRIRGVNSQYSKDHELGADIRDLRVYGLSPASAYAIQLRVCDKGGHWGMWSPPVNILTRGTILTEAVEVAENYAVIRWERRKAPNPHGYPTGKGQVTSYHLRVYNTDGIHMETFLGDRDCPFKITELNPDTYYCVELKANYNDEEWGLWSTPLWCLTMPTMLVQTKLISEEFCRLSIERTVQPRRLPSADNNRFTVGEEQLAFGQVRPCLMLCVSTPITDRIPHTSSSFIKPKFTTSALPPEALDHRLIYQTEIVSIADITEHSVPNLRSNTVYCVSVRSKLQNGEWGLWAPSMLFATVPTTRVFFKNIGENYLEVEWRRRPQLIPPSIDADKVALGMDNIGASRVRIREIGGSYQHLYTVIDSSKILRLENLKPATTFAVSAQTYNDNYEWGVWSEESKVRTATTLEIHIPHISENALWVSWTRKTDFDIIDTDTYVNVNVQARSYMVMVTGAGGFCYTKELQSNALFFRGLQPDTIYAVSVKACFGEEMEWGQWSTRWFRTHPRLRVTFGNIGEHFANMEWRRHLPLPIDPTMEVQGPVAEAEDVVQQFRVKVQRVGDDRPLVFNLGPSISSFSLRDLDPNSEYRVWMCAKGYEGVWGVWNEETRVRTLSKLEIQLDSIGENYAKVRWDRLPWTGQTVAEDGVLVRQFDGAVSEYEIRIKDQNGEVVFISKAGPHEREAIMPSLALNSLFSVDVRAKDTYDEWGLWSDAKQFLTLKAVSLNLLRFGETFMDLEWARCGVLKPHPFGQLETPSNSDLSSENVGDNDEEGSSLTTPTHVTLEVEEGETRAVYPEGVILPDERIRQWQIRYVSKRVHSGVPKEGEEQEFFVEAEELWRRVNHLVPDCQYTVFVRGKDWGGEWGEWSLPLEVVTYPLLKIEMELVGETFFNMRWARPEMKDPFYLPIVCFPHESDIHNYEVSVRPMATEPAFREEDEPLTDGARVYETTQPSLRLGNLTSGTRYMVGVREQHIGDDGKPIEDSWGAYSEVYYLETSPPLKAVPVEIGEDYCLVQWKRDCRPIDQDSDLFVTPHLEKVEAFEIRTQRLNDDAATVCEGQLAMDGTLTLPPSATQYHISALTHSTVYLVQVRGRGESNTWGPWSKKMKFITQSRLRLLVEAVYETSIQLSWIRPLPTWALERQKEEWDENAFKSSREPSPYDEVLLGDYSIDHYELVVSGISCALHRCITIDATKSSAFIEDLDQNQIYSVCVRSISLKQHWSQFSNKESLLTLQAMRVVVAHIIENACVLRWHRPPSDVTEFSPLLEKAVGVAQRECDEREGRDLYELKRRLQEMEGRGEKVSGWMDQETRQEHNAFLRQEAVHHFLIENVHLGDTVNAAFHLQFLGAAGECCPFIPNYDLVVRRTLPKKREKGHSSRKLRGLMEAQVASTSEGTEESSILSEGTLIDIILRDDVHEIVIQGLENNTNYEARICSLNVQEAWQPWGPKSSFRTLRPISLDQSRFGEHYINLFWHRMEEQKTLAMMKDMEAYKVLQSEFAEYAEHGDLEAKREGMSEKEHAAFLDRLKEFKELHLRIAKKKHLMADGKAQLLVASNTNVNYFLIRIIQESGEYLEYKVPNTENGRAFTVTGLLPNCMYVCLLCPCYGENFWGMWTSPLKFMTQNLVQLKLTYVGESFVDIEWHRMANKLPPLADRDDTIVSSLFSEEEQLYQLRIEFEDPNTGDAVEEIRDMRACNVFRVDGLLPDTKYTISVREWDAKGDWGLWCTSRTCVTLPGMSTSIDDIGEDWAVVSWSRQPKRINYDNDMHVLQSGVQTTSVYLRVVELLKDPGNEDSFFAEEANEKGELKKTEELGIGGFFSGKKQREGPLPPKKHPDQVEQTEGRFILIQHFDAATQQFTLNQLKPDKFYCVQVLAETTGGQLGMWSVQNFMLTHSKIVLSVKYIDEQYIDIQWVRNGPRDIESLNLENVYVGSYVTTTYELEAEGVNLSLMTSVGPNVNNFRLTGLSLDTIYIARIRSINDKNQSSMWSDILCMVTLNPVIVRPVEITESSMIIEWGRLEQKPEDYPQTETPLQIGSRVSSSYELRVGVCTENGVKPLLERSFGGDEQQLVVPQLTPNSAYVLCARARNTMDEYGLWSENRCVYTMQLLRVSIAAVGENYVRLSWGRPAPDVVVCKSEEGSEPVCPFPLLDQPEEVGPVYNSAFSKIVNYAIQVKLDENADMEVEGDRVIVAGEHSDFTLRNLQPDTVYRLSVNACYESAEWGPYSLPVRTSTYNLLSLDVKDAGEDYLATTWQRLSNRVDLQTMMMGKVEETICYELGICDFTEKDLIEDRKDDAYLTENHIRSSFVPRKQRHCLIKGLSSNHRYLIAVRRWYLPNQRFIKDCPPEEPRTDDESIRDLIRQKEAVPGAWSEPDAMVTLKDMVCTATAIGENTFSVHWERDPRAVHLPTRKQYTPKPPLAYHIRVDELLDDGSEISHAPDTFHSDKVIPASETSFTATGLKSNCVYRVELCCSCVDKIWGRWSAPLYIITQPKLQVEVTQIEEDSASLSWRRKLRNLVLPDGISAIIGDRESNGKYQLEVEGVGFSYHVSKKFSGSRTSYHLKHLEPNSLFSILIRSNDSSTNTWSLWSETVYFATLKPLTLHLGLPAEQFINVDWFREQQNPEAFKDIVDAPVQLGSPQVIAYHLCVFQTQEMPGVAVVDKQFYPDVNQFRIQTLTPDLPYVAIVRACYAGGRWGLWSQEQAFQTQSLLNFEVHGVGETYVNFKWCRGERDRVTAVAYPTAYLIVVKSAEGSVEKTIDVSECGVTDDESPLACYHFDGLVPGVSYAAALQPIYGAHRGMWSNAISISTLAPLSITAEILNGGFQLHWERKKEVGFAEPVSTIASPEQQNMPQELMQPVKRTVLRYQFAACRAEEADLLLLDDNEAPSEESRSDTGEDNESGGSTPEIPTVPPTNEAGEVAAAAAEAGPYSNIEEEGSSSSEAGEGHDDEPGLDRASPNAPTERLDTPPAAISNVFKVVRDIETEDTDEATCTLQDLEPDMRYLARVRALDMNGVWGQWVDHLFTTQPPAPSGLVLRKVNAQFCALQWKEAPESQGAYIYYVEQNVTELPSGRKNILNNLSWEEVEQIDETVCPIRINLTPHSLYCRIRSQHKGSITNPFSEYSQVVGLSSGTPPQPITNLTVAALSRYGATLEWTPPPKPDVQRYSKPVYNIYLRKEKSQFILIATVNQTTHTLNELLPNVEYVAQVVAENADGSSYTNPMIRFHTKQEEDVKIYVPEPHQPLGEIVDRAEEFREECRNRSGGDPCIPTSQQALVPRRPSGIRGPGGQRFMAKRMMRIDGSETEEAIEGRRSSSVSSKKGRKKSKSKKSKRKGSKKGKKGSKKGRRSKSAKKKGSPVKLPPIVDPASAA